MKTTTTAMTAMLNNTRTRASFRGAARSTSICRRAFTSSAAASAICRNTPGTRSDARADTAISNANAITSPRESSIRSANCRNATDRSHRAVPSRPASSLTSGRIASGALAADRTIVATGAPPTAMESASRRTHSSSASRRSMRRCISRPTVKKAGRKNAAAPAATPPTGQPVSTHVPRPTAAAMPNRMTRCRRIVAAPDPSTRDRADPGPDPGGARDLGPTRSPSRHRPRQGHRRSAR